MLTKRKAQGDNSSTIAFSKKSFEQILSISIIAQPLPQSSSLPAQRSLTRLKRLSYPRPSEAVLPFHAGVGCVVSGNDDVAGEPNGKLGGDGGEDSWNE